MTHVSLKSAPAGLLLDRELGLFGQGFGRVAGIDEVGRGPLAGPVTAAAVILDPRNIPAGLADSKVLPAEVREAVFHEIAHSALAVGIGFATPGEIDGINIRQATFLAMRRALAALAVSADYVLVDGRDRPGFGALPCEPIVKGDATCASIAAASIVAKVARDRLMVRQHGRDGRYGFHRHKGYATLEHRDALAKHGPSPFHRRSFAPCALPADDRLDGTMFETNG